MDAARNMFTSGEGQVTMFEGPPKIGGEVGWTVRTNFARILLEVCRDPNEFGPRRFPCRSGCPNFSGPRALPSPAPDSRVAGYYADQSSIRGDQFVRTRTLQRYV